LHVISLSLDQVFGHNPLRRLHVCFELDSNWIIGLFVSFVIGQTDYFGFGFGFTHTSLEYFI